MITALIFGLISSLHCVGMCGPIAIMLPISRKERSKQAVQVIAYHLGRISAYSLLGLVFGVFGRGLYLAGVQQQMSIIVGVLMIIFILVPQNRLGKVSFLKPLYFFINKVKTKMSLQFKKQHTGSLYLLGFFNGFLPCGMVYVALFGALATQDLFLATIYMALFGIGTVPLMSAIIYTNSLFSVKVRQNIMKYYPYVIVFFGMLFIMRGLGLSVPFLSPGNLSLFVSEVPNC